MKRIRLDRLFGLASEWLLAALVRPIQMATSGRWSWVAQRLGFPRKIWVEKKSGKAWTFPVEAVISAVWMSRTSRPGALPVEVTICHEDSHFWAWPTLRVWNLVTPPVPFRAASFCAISGAPWQQLSDCSFLYRNSSVPSLLLLKYGCWSTTHLLSHQHYHHIFPLFLFPFLLSNLQLGYLYVFTWRHKHSVFP